MNRQPHPLVLALARRRVALHMTQLEVAARLPVNNKTVSRWEVGDTVPNVKDAEAYARAVGARWVLVDEPQGDEAS